MIGGFNPSRRDYWMLAAALVFGVVLILVGMRSWNQSFSGSLSSDYLFFRTSSAVETYPIITGDIQISFQGSISGPLGEFSSEKLEGERMLLRIEAPAPKGSPDTQSDVSALTTVQPISVPAGTDLTFTSTRFGNEIEITARGAQLDLIIEPQVGARIVLENPLCMVDQDCPVDRFEEFDEAIFISGNTLDDMQIRLSKLNAEQPIADVAHVEHLRTWELLETPVGMFDRSGLNSGTLQFASVPDRLRSFFTGELIDLDSRSMMIRSLVAHDLGYRLQVSGELRDASVKLGDTKVSLMPTWFDVISNNSRTRYTIGALSILIGLFQLLNWEKFHEWRRRT